MLELWRPCLPLLMHGHGRLSDTGISMKVTKLRELQSQSQEVSDALLLSAEGAPAGRGVSRRVVRMVRNRPRILFEYDV